MSDELSTLLNRDNWRVTPLGKYCLVVWASHAIATIDLRGRCFRAGGNVTHGRTVNEKPYTGRSWKRRLADDVAEFLDGMKR